MENQKCKAHSGIEKSILTLEDNVRKLWAKWDSMQKMILGIFITLSLNLIGVLFLLLK